MRGFLRSIFFIFAVVCVNALPQDVNSPNDLISNEGTLETSDISNGADAVPNEIDPGSIAWISNEPDNSNNVKIGIADTVNAENPSSFTTDYSHTVNGADETDPSLMTWLDAQTSANLVTPDASTPDTGLKAGRPGAKKPPNPRLSGPPPFYCSDGRNPVCCHRVWSAGRTWKWEDCVFWNEFLDICKKGEREPADCCRHIYYPLPNVGVDCEDGYAHAPDYQPKKPENEEDATVQQADPITGALYATPPKYKAPDGGVPDEGPPARNRFLDACPAKLDKDSC